MPGLFGTLALPAYAALPDDPEAEVDAATAETVAAAVQSFRVDSTVAELPIERSEISTTAPSQLWAKRAPSHVFSIFVSGALALCMFPADQNVCCCVAVVGLFLSLLNQNWTFGVKKFERRFFGSKDHRDVLLPQSVRHGTT